MVAGGKETLMALEFAAGWETGPKSTRLNTPVSGLLRQQEAVEDMLRRAGTSLRAFGRPQTVLGYLLRDFGPVVTVVGARAEAWTPNAGADSGIVVLEYRGLTYEVGVQLEGFRLMATDIS